MPFIILGTERMYPGAYAQNERWIVCICGKMNKPRASKFFVIVSSFQFIQSFRLLLVKYYFI